jgi:hypothetical protein
VALELTALCIHKFVKITGSVKLIRTSIRFLTQPKSMRSIVGATQ